MKYVVRVEALYDAVDELRADGQDFVEIHLCETNEKERPYIELLSWKTGNRDAQVSKLYAEKL